MLIAAIKRLYCVSAGCPSPLSLWYWILSYCAASPPASREPAGGAGTVVGGNVVV